MALNFPDSPVLNEIFEDPTNGFSYQWDGAVWQTYIPASINIGFNENEFVKYDSVRDINSVGIITSNNVTIGGGTTDLLVIGNARITERLTIGTATIVLDGTTNSLDLGGTVISPTGIGSTTSDIVTRHLNATGVATALVYYGDGSGLTGVVTTGGIVGYATEGYVDTQVGLATVGLSSEGYVDNVVGLATVGLSSEGYVDTQVGLATVGLSSEGYVNTQVGLATVGLISTNSDASLSSLSVTGDVSIGGTLTYEDVISVDSVGLITARSGVRISAGGLEVTGDSTFNDNIIGDTATNISGINSVTAVTYYGDGSGLTGVANTGIINADQINVSGVVTASSFVGDGSSLTGVANTGIINSDQINVSGVVTASSFVGDGSNLTGIVGGGSTANVSTNTLVVAGIATFNDNIIGDTATNISGINSVTATAYYGDGSNLSGITASGSILKDVQQTSTTTGGPVISLFKTGNANNTAFLAENTRGDHSWGIVGEFRTGNSGGDDRPSILFSSTQASNTWSVGYGFYTDDNFRIKEGHGYRLDPLVNTGWGNSRFSIESSTGNLYAGEIGFNKIWNEGNDGAGSGLDADLLDGNDSGAFIRSNVSTTVDAQAMLRADGFICKLQDVYLNDRSIVWKDAGGSEAARTGNSIDHMWLGNKEPAWGYPSTIGRVYHLVSNVAYKTNGGSNAINDTGSAALRVGLLDCHYSRARYLDVNGPITCDTLLANGEISGDTKNFTIDHPTREGMMLRHGCLEGPESGVYVRGKLTGSDTIELPEYWTGLVHEDSITVNLTPIGRNAPLHSVVDIVNNTIVVESANDNVNCFYTVYGERKDVDKLKVELTNEEWNVMKSTGNI